MDSEDNIFYKISKMIDEKLVAFKSDIEDIIREATNDYKKLMEQTQVQEGRINSLEEFKKDYKPVLDKINMKVYTISIVVPVIIMFVSGVIFALIQRGVIG